MLGQLFASTGDSHLSLMSSLLLACNNKETIHQAGE
jgi:hypothetical protein